MQTDIEAEPAGKTRPFSFRILRIAVCAAVTLLFLMNTSPSKIPAMFLVVPFFGIFITLYLILLEVVRFVGADDDQAGAILRLRRPRLAAAVIAGLPVLLLVLQSIVELTLWDVLIAVGILLLGYLYIARGSVSFKRGKA